LFNRETALSANDTPWLSDEHEAATAIVLAGGKSKRMGVDKSLLPFRGKPLIQHVCDQVRPHFDEILIAGGENRQFGFLEAPVVPDEVPDQGPLRGIASALAASCHDLNFVIACDVPFVNCVLLRTLLQESHGYDCVVPVTVEGHYEPLFAIYRKSALPGMLHALEEGKRRVIAAFPHCRVKAVAFSGLDGIENINTMSDYNMLTHGMDINPTNQISQ
jgi:molybdenum cofactor guanylyltransferase